MISKTLSISKLGFTEMNKTRIIASELLKKRVQEKSKDKLQYLNIADFQIVGGDGQGFSPSLIVNSEGRSYLFNCGSGLQRFCYTNKIKLSNLNDVFITNLVWSRVSGVHGLSLTLQDVGAPHLCIHSTAGIKDFFGATRMFMFFNTGIQCTTKEHLNDEFTDEGLRVQTIVLDERAESHASDSSDDSSENAKSHDQKRAKLNSKLIAYVCSLPDLPGALDPQKCKELKVPIGRHLGLLKAGQNIVLADGREIKSSQVCGPKNLGLNFLVLECPSDNHIEQMLANNRLNQVRGHRKDNSGQQIDLVVHFSPQKVTNNPKYREWLQGFDENCKHVFLSNNDSNRINFVESYRLQNLLNRLDNKIFPNLYLSENLTKMIEEEHLNCSSDEQAKQTQANILLGDDEIDGISKTVVKCDFDSLNSVSELNSLDRIFIRPHKYVEILDVPISIDELYREAETDQEFEKELDTLKFLQKTFPSAQDHEPEVVFLGTGSALPSKLRNTSCILLNLYHPEKASVILDCGEDSYGQLYRYYGPIRVGEILEQIKLIYVSHQHADHHLGLIQLLLHRRKYTDEPVLLLLPPGIDSLLKYHNQNFEDLSSTYRIFSTYPLITRPTRDMTDSPTIDAIKRDLLEQLNGLLEDLKIVGVEHCIHSCAVVMRFRIGHPDMSTFTLCYSGDARPSEDFALAGKDCDLLIHEATFDHRSQSDALVKKHCTSSEAIHVAKQMQAKFTILTHFSQRIPKIPYFTPEFDDSIGFAFDNMTVRCPSHFGRIPIMKPILQRVFKKSLDEIDTKYEKQDLKQKFIQDLIKSKQAES